MRKSALRTDDGQHAARTGKPRGQRIAQRPVRREFPREQDQVVFGKSRQQRIETGRLGNLGNVAASALLRGRAREPAPALDARARIARNAALRNERHDPRDAELGQLLDHEIHLPAFGYGLRDVHAQGLAARVGDRFGQRRDDGLAADGDGRDEGLRARIGDLDAIAVAKAQYDARLARIVGGQGDLVAEFAHAFDKKSVHRRAPSPGGTRP